MAYNGSQRQDANASSITSLTVANGRENRVVRCLERFSFFYRLLNVIIKCLNPPREYRLRF